jgi:hypothetical protein
VPAGLRAGRGDLHCGPDLVPECIHGRSGLFRRRGCRPAADEILIVAARAGARQEDLAGLAAEIYARSLPEGEDDPEPRFEDRQVRIETTFAGAAVLTGDLTPDCAAVVTAVLESPSAPMGAEDTRSREQRYHDGLQEAMRRLGFCIVIWFTSMTPTTQVGIQAAAVAAGMPMGERGSAASAPGRMR